MQNAEILTIAQALTADARVFGWSGKNGRTIEIHAVVSGERLFQIRDTQGPAQIEVLPFPMTEEGLVEARAIARFRAQLNQM